MTKGARAESAERLGGRFGPITFCELNVSGMRCTEDFQPANKGPGQARGELELELGMRGESSVLRVGLRRQRGGVVPAFKLDADLSSVGVAAVCTRHR